VDPNAFEDMLEQAAIRAVARSEIRILIEIENLIERVVTRALEKMKEGDNK
jgi:hypothetical protein